MSLIKLLADLPDSRRGQGQRYQLNYVLVSSVLSILCGARSYRDIQRFIKVHLDRLNKLWGMKWKRAPAHTTLRDILKGIKQQVLEWYFRQHSETLRIAVKGDERTLIAIDAKALRRSFDHMDDKGALNLIGAYCLNNDFILGHIEAADKSNEIPAVQQMLKGFGLKDCLYTMDAMHCQKKLLI
jgi:hypothetical protein